MAEKKEAIFTMLSGMEDQADSSDFITKPLFKKLSCSFYHPSYLDIEAIQNYFGEKIALYFEFLTYHTKKLFWIGCVGIIIFIIDLFMTEYIKSNGLCFEATDCPDQTVAVLTETKIKQGIKLDPHDYALIIFKINRIVLSIITVIWSTYYLDYWKRKQ